MSDKLQFVVLQRNPPQIYTDCADQSSMTEVGFSICLISLTCENL